MTRAQEYAGAALLLSVIGIALLHFTGSSAAGGVFFGGALVELAFLGWTILARAQQDRG